MAIYFPHSNSLLLLTPKTGTVWVREALKRSGVYHIAIGPPELRFHGYLSLFGREFSGIAAFVRNRSIGIDHIGRIGPVATPNETRGGILTPTARARCLIAMLKR